MSTSANQIHLRFAVNTPNAIIRLVPIHANVRLDSVKTVQVAQTLMSVLLEPVTPHQKQLASIIRGLSNVLVVRDMLVTGPLASPHMNVLLSLVTPSK